MRILVIEDNQRLSAALATGLGDAGHTVEVAGDGAAGLRIGLEARHDAIVLDLMLPELDGMSVLRRLRNHGVGTPVLILSARDTVPDRIGGLDQGADDYLIKPFAFDELLARLRALVRRHLNAASNQITIDDLIIDTEAHTVERAGRPVTLSAREYAILEYLALRRGRVVTREQLLDALYLPGDAPASNVVDVYVSQLRRKLEDGGAHRLLHTRRGLGYVLEEPA